MIEISLFKNVQSPDVSESMDLFYYLEQIRTGKWEDLVNKVRLAKTDEERRAIKNKLPTATMSGLFMRRNDASLVKHSGYIAVDIDDILDINSYKAKLITDPFTVAVYVSVGGRGLRAIFKIKPNKHIESFDGLSLYLYETYGIIIDPNGRNVSKPYLVSFDPDIYVNPDEAVPIFDRYPPRRRSKEIKNFTFVKSDLIEVVEKIVSTGTNICENYFDWLKIGFALSSEFGESGRDVFHSLSSVSKKYNYRRTDKQYDYCLKSKGSMNDIGISSLFYLAKQAGIPIVSETTKQVIQTTKSGKKAGLSKEQISKNLAKFSSITGVDETISEVYDNLIEDDEGDSYIPELEMYINSNYELKMNSVTGYIEDCGIPMMEADINSLYIAAKKKIPKLDYKVLKRLLKSDFIPSYNPFHDFLKSNGVPTKLPDISVPQSPLKYQSPLIDELASCIRSHDAEYTKYFIKKWIVGMISSMHYEHSPLQLALVGQQGTGKTEFFRKLLPRELMPYYAESSLDRGKDDEILMTENIIVMDDELSGKNVHDSRAFNNLASKQVFSVRRPYGDSNEKIPRLAMLCGTSNYLNVVSDPTGNRRRAPIQVYSIDIVKYNSIDKNELIMEAYMLYRKGFDWRVISNEDITYLNKHLEDYASVNVERELITKFFKIPTENDDEVRLYTSEVLYEIEMATRQKLSLQKVGQELVAMGFQKKGTRINQFATAKLWVMTRTNRGGTYVPVSTWEKSRDKYENTNDETPF